MTETPTDRDLHRIFCLLRPLTNDLVQNNAGRGFRAVQVFEALSGNYLYRASANLTSVLGLWRLTIKQEKEFDFRKYTFKVRVL